MHWLISLLVACSLSRHAQHSANTDMVNTLRLGIATWWTSERWLNHGILRNGIYRRKTLNYNRGLVLHFFRDEALGLVDQSTQCRSHALKWRNRFYRLHSFLLVTGEKR